MYMYAMGVQAAHAASALIYPQSQGMAQIRRHCFVCSR